MVLAIHGKGGLSDSFQREIGGRVREWESRDDSRNGNWGPAAMALALDAYGVPGYEVRAFESRQSALRDAARTIQSTGAPVILLAWRGAHTWVMTGFRADADPTVFRDAHIDGRLRPGPVVPARVIDLGSLRSAGHLPERVGDGAQLPEVAPAGGSLPGSGRAVHHGRADGPAGAGRGLSGPGSTGMRRMRPTSTAASRAQRTVTPRA